MQESLAHAQRVVLIVVRGNADLPDKLFLGGGKLRGSHPDITQALQFLVDQAGTVIQICGVAAEVDAEGARIGIGGQVGLHVTSPRRSRRETFKRLFMPGPPKTLFSR